MHHVASTPQSHTCECRCCVAGLLMTGCMRAHACIHALYMCVLTNLTRLGFSCVSGYCMFYVGLS